MRISRNIKLLSALLAVLVMTGCAGTGGQAMAKPGKKLQDTERLSLAPKDLFAQKLPKKNVKTLAVTGDSLSIGLASELEKSLGAKPGLGYVSLGKVSSGLAHPDFFDWERNMESLARRYRPDAVAVMLGTNDNKHLRMPDGSQIFYGTPEWDKAYAGRVKRMVEIIRSHNEQATVFWIGAPITGVEDLNRDLRHINAIAKKTMATLRDCHYVDTWRLFSAPDGGFAFSRPDVEGGATLRARDGIHMTAAGSQALASLCQSAMETRFIWGQEQAKPAPLAGMGY
jgi:hypothetical protein